jgi:hypothetical protein
MRMMMSLLVVAEPKNVKRKSFTVDKEETVRVLIKRFATRLEWKMERKPCIGYNCFKATAIKPVNKSDF